MRFSRQSAKKAYDRISMDIGTLGALLQTSLTGLEDEQVDWESAFTRITITEHRIHNMDIVIIFYTFLIRCCIYLVTLYISRFV